MSPTDNALGSAPAAARLEPFACRTPSTESDRRPPGFDNRGGSTNEEARRSGTRPGNRRGAELGPGRARGVRPRGGDRGSRVRRDERPYPCDLRLGGAVGRLAGDSGGRADWPGSRAQFLPDNGVGRSDGVSGPSLALGRPHQRNRRVSLYGGALREDKENRSRRSSTSARSVFAKHFPIV